MRGTELIKSIGGISVHNESTDVEDVSEYCPPEWKKHLAGMKCRVVTKQGKHNKQVRMAICEKQGMRIVLPIDKRDMHYE